MSEAQGVLEFDVLPPDVPKILNLFACAACKRWGKCHFYHASETGLIASRGVVGAECMKVSTH